MKKLLAQIFKFAIVGGISFVVDFLVYTIMCNVLHIHYIIAGVSGFTVSVVVITSLVCDSFLCPKRTCEKIRNL